MPSRRSSSRAGKARSTATRSHAALARRSEGAGQYGAAGDGGRDSKQIDATGALSGDDLIRSIPQMGDVSFNPSNNPQTSNAARGDVNSINLRNLGVGNTLVLLNGRRLVQHPASQAGEGNVPVLGYNSNASRRGH
jgi:iron complex outermembrane receptor protein